MPTALPGAESLDESHRKWGEGLDELRREWRATDERLADLILVLEPPPDDGLTDEERRQRARQKYRVTPPMR